MSKIPENQLSQKDLEVWYEMTRQLAKLKASESLLRKKIFNAAFPNPQVGMNKYDLSDGWVLKGNYPIIRDIDVGALGAIREKLREQGVNADELVRYKMELKKAEYNKLTDEHRSTFDQCLIIRLGSPSLEIVPPAKNKAVVS